jgi:Coenzyme PQQ synthesis protein D (PqqD)
VRHSGKNIQKEKGTDFRDMPVPVCLTRSKDVIAQEVKDETVLFHMSTGKYYSLNELGSRAWSLFEHDCSISEVAAKLSSEYDASAETIEQDLEPLVDELIRGGLLVDAS